jgi:hypothetical protein
LHVDLRADRNVLLVSANSWRRGDAADSALEFQRAPLLHGEECEIAVDVYAVAAGESTLAVSARSGGIVRELELRCACEGYAAFAACANRLAVFASEAESGAETSGRITLTNTGNAPARVQLGVEGLEAVTFDPGPTLEAMPGQRFEIALRGRFPNDLPDGSQHEVRAFLTHGSTEAVLGTAAMPVRGRPSITCELDSRGPEWLLRVRNDGARAATLAIAGLHVGALEPQETLELAVASSEIGSPAPQNRRASRAALDPGAVRQLRTVTGFARHLWAIAVLFADASELTAVRTALRSVFDRLLIKLRMPHYPLHADDVLDRPAREALCAVGAAASADLPSMLDRAASLIDGEEDVRAYRSALRARLCAMRDDGTLIAALTGADTELDVLLDAILR